ncbi:MAG: PfkB family carbohydrate kinase [Chloroflexi bacterium]|nr:PfkB family carbohydrate kinase [Chloroflexota bacterium]
MFDIAFVGHFTKDTVVNSQGSTVNLGGAFYYGANVAVRMGLKAAVVTRLAREDWVIVDELKQMGVTLFARATPESTNLRIVYPTANLDERTIYAVGSAGPFAPEEVAPVEARAFHIGASIRGEVPLSVVEALAAKKTRLSLDVQGFIRVNEGGTLRYANWPEMPQVLRFVNVLKADSTEAEFLTGKQDMRAAAEYLASFGPQEIVLTQNSGVLVLAQGQLYEERWRVKEIKGRTGRGDTCISSYLCKRLTASPAAAARFAATLTGRKLQAPGPFRGEVPSDQDLD